MLQDPDRVTKESKTLKRHFLIADSRQRLNSSLKRGDSEKVNLDMFGVDAGKDYSMTIGTCKWV